MKLDVSSATKAASAIRESLFTSPTRTIFPSASIFFRSRIAPNMSTRAAETLREDLESRGPVRVSEVEAEQKEMLKIVRRLADEGQVVLGGGGDDQFL